MKNGDRVYYKPDNHVVFCGILTEMNDNGFGRVSLGDRYIGNVFIDVPLKTLRVINEDN